MTHRCRVARGTEARYLVRGRRPFADRRTWRRDDGIATVVTCMYAIALASVTALVLQVGAATVARHRAQTAADLGALAGAAMVLEGEDRACAAAASIVQSNGARVQTCTTDGADVLLTVTVVARLGPLTGNATGRARAGPVADQTP